MGLLPLAGRTGSLARVRSGTAGEGPLPRHRNRQPKPPTGRRERTTDGVGFEPTRPLWGPHALQACAFSRSATHPEEPCETDRVGFEPTIPSPVYRFSRPAPSAARPPVRKQRNLRTLRPFLQPQPCTSSLGTGRRTAGIDDAPHIPPGTRASRSVAVSDRLAWHSQQEPAGAQTGRWRWTWARSATRTRDGNHATPRLGRIRFPACRVVQAATRPPGAFLVLSFARASAPDGTGPRRDILPFTWRSTL